MTSYTAAGALVAVSSTTPTAALRRSTSSSLQRLPGNSFKGSRLASAVLSGRNACRSRLTHSVCAAKKKRIATQAKRTASDGKATSAEEESTSSSTENKETTADEKPTTRKDSAAPWAVSNDYEDYVLVSQDAEDISAEVAKLQKENEALRRRLQQAIPAAQKQSQNPYPSEQTLAAIAEAVDVQRPRRAARPPADVAGNSRVAVPATESISAPSNAPPARDAPSNETSGNGGAKADESWKSSVKKTENPMSIVFVTSEVAPWSKTGGLADVAGSLPIALAQRGHRVMVVAPRYLNGVSDALYDSALDLQVRINLPLFQGVQEVAYFHSFKNGVDWVFVDHPAYHRAGNPYGDSRGAFGDNQFRFTLLSLAAAEAPLQLKLGGYTYGERVVFMGVEAAVTFKNLGLPGEWYGALEWVFPEWARAHALDKGEAVNFLKGAIVTADRIVTVSKGYAWEIQTVEGGWGLDGLLRSRASVVDGIVNGIDLDEWNPATDKFTPAHYSINDMEGKKECKRALQQELGLPQRADVPLIGFIGRLDYQKGPDIIQQAIPEMMRADVQLVMLGSGDKDMEAYMGWAESAYPDKFRGWVGFSVPVAHRITAGCDILLMPSRFEPCGLNQLYAMRYGTVPVVHATGGLRDTVEDYNPYGQGLLGSGTGWTFSPANAQSMLGALWTCVGTYWHHKEAWEGIMRRDMEQDFSWDKSAAQYEQIFRWAMMDRSYA
eukprot:jgi/Chlat1/6059/Chrsp4S06337